MAGEREKRTGAGLPPWTETTVVGQPLARVDAYERVSGAALYTTDISLPEMLHLAILRCPHAHAFVRKVEVARARTLPGVCAVLTNADPEASVILPYASWVEGGPPMRLFDPHCRYAGEEVTAVAAESPHAAWDAVRAIEVEYEELPFVLGAEQATRPGAPLVHEGGNVVRPPSVIQRGDVAKGFEEAEAVSEETYQTSCEIHATSEPHVSVARWDGQRLTVWESTQCVFDEQGYLATAFGLPLSAVQHDGHQGPRGARHHPGGARHSQRRLPRRRRSSDPCADHDHGRAGPPGRWLRRSGRHPLGAILSRRQPHL